MTQDEKNYASRLLERVAQLTLKLESMEEKMVTLDAIRAINVNLDQLQNNLDNVLREMQLYQEIMPTLKDIAFLKQTDTIIAGILNDVNRLRDSLLTHTT